MPLALKTAQKHEGITPLVAINTILSGSYPHFKGEHYPQIDLLVVLDIMSVLTRFGRTTTKQLSSRMNTAPHINTLRKYINILTALGLISVESTYYRGVTRSKHFFQVTEKGRQFYALIKLNLQMSNIMK